MVANSKIEWTDHTFSPWVGCTKISSACDHCYAEGWAKRAGSPELWQGERRRTTPANWAQPLKWDRQARDAGTRPRVFCASLADVFDNQVDPQWRADLFELIRKTPSLDWLLLTKRIGNAIDMIDETVELTHGEGWQSMWTQGEPPANVWLGATVANQEEADRDIPKLLATPARVRFLSCEPLLGPIDLRGLWTHCPTHDFPGGFCVQDCGNWRRINWVIVGGESGPKARPMHPAWARSLRDQCVAAGVAFHFKQWGQWMPTSSADWARSSTASYHAAFREKYGRGGYEFPGREGRALLADGRVCYSDPPRTITKGHPTIVVDAAAASRFQDHCNGIGSDPGYQWMYAVGKKESGRLLDGRTWDQFPQRERE